MGHVREFFEILNIWQRHQRFAKSEFAYRSIAILLQQIDPNEIAQSD
jgi:hypothetical protein